MSDPLHVSANEHGRVRIFTAELAPDGASAITAGNVGRLLNVDLNPKKVEVVPSGVFRELGLTGYLSEGYGIPEASMEGRKAALDALTGLVILVPSSAFRGKDQTIEPESAIRLVGVFDEEPQRAHDMAPHSSEPAEVSPRGMTPDPRPDPRGKSTLIVLGALIVAAGLVAMFYL